MVQMFGHVAVYGERRLGVGEMRRMNLAQRVINAYNMRAGYRNADGVSSWAEWAERNPDDARLLTTAAMEANG
jgi:hypothetical protein